MYVRIEQLPCVCETASNAIDSMFRSHNVRKRWLDFSEYIALSYTSQAHFFFLNRRTRNNFFFVFVVVVVYLLYSQWLLSCEWVAVKKYGEKCHVIFYLRWMKTHAAIKWRKKMNQNVKQTYTQTSPFRATCRSTKNDMSCILSFSSYGWYFNGFFMLWIEAQRRTIFGFIFCTCILRNPS